jgi:hypothetical protein
MRLAVGRKTASWLQCTAVVLACVAVALLPQDCRCRTVYVDDVVLPGEGDGSSPNPFGLISEAMGASSTGDTIAVRPGLYSEFIGVDMHDSMGMNTTSVVMKDGVTLRSTAGPDSTTILGVGCEAVVYFDGSGDGTALVGFSLRSEGYGWGLRAGVVCYSAQPTIHGNVMVNAGEAAIYCREQSAPTISENCIGNVPISMVSGSGGFISGNTVAGRIGVHSTAENSLPVLIEGNVIGSQDRRPWEDIGVSVSSLGPGEVLVYDNTIQGKDVGAELCRGVLWHNRFINNTVNLRARDYCDVWEDIQATENWWGTADSLEVSQLIVDCHDDANLEPCVTFEPWCIDETCTTTIVREETWTSLKALYR